MDSSKTSIVLCTKQIGLSNVSEYQGNAKHVVLISLYLKNGLYQYQGDKWLYGKVDVTIWLIIARAIFLIHGQKPAGPELVFKNMENLWAKECSAGRCLKHEHHDATLVPGNSRMVPPSPYSQNRNGWVQGQSLLALCSNHSNLRLFISLAIIIILKQDKHVFLNIERRDVIWMSVLLHVPSSEQ
jgi:hypothetical protein